MSGSTSVARRAGNKDAAAPTAMTTPTTAENVQGSVADTPQISLESKRVNHGRASTVLTGHLPGTRSAIRKRSKIGPSELINHCQ
ncbi:MAG: hypothetical protein DMG76_31915 [Acidobacteria bacterium]|nr:MAG: hypothetical protein DMG76_31915 [Acidobacteriota bacterium]